MDEIKKMFEEWSSKEYATREAADSSLFKISKRADELGLKDYFLKLMVNKLWIISKF